MNKINLKQFLFILITYLFIDALYESFDVYQYSAKQQ